MLTPHIVRFESLPSTNLEAAKRAGEGAPEGVCIIAAEQTAGRGRLERQWVSPKGAGLYFSIVLRPQFEQNSWPLITLMAAVAVHDALLDIYQLRTDIKWPNDVLANEKKLCGILAETVETPIGRAVVLGIGINLKHGSFPMELEDIATSVETAVGRSAELELTIKTLADALAGYYQMLQLKGGPEMIVKAWSARSSYASGKRIRVANGDKILEGTSRGLECDGALRIETDAGEIRIVRTGDVTSVRSA
jgi:BirA family biotin operon repressor/biotin-[acetyl-CoA-carboxylase] ligase